MPIPTDTPARPTWQVPVLAQDDRILGGVCGGTARELGVDANLLRSAALLLVGAGGWGVLLYAAAWGGLAQLNYAGHGARLTPTAKGRTSQHRLAGVAFIVTGLVIFFSTRPIVPADVSWPVALAGLGLHIAWRSVGDPDRPERPVVSAHGIAGAGIAIGGVALALAGLGIQGGWVGWTGGFVALGLLVVTAPWIARLARDLDSERQARLIADERSDIAAHLHDSVLQTLALIQRHDDPQLMKNLARRQERELRNWLDRGRVDRSGNSLRARLDEIATEVEELHGVPVEIVNAGDCHLDDRVDAALAAAREATVNAARHSGAERIDVFAEVGAEFVEIFVRDVGVGFDPSTIDPDRRGVRHSIEGRIRRAGGRTAIHSSPGDGTEVEIAVPRPATPGAEP